MPYFVPMMSSLKILPISPSSPFDRAKVQAGLSLLSNRGFPILEPAKKRDFSFAYLNGSDDERFRELQNAISRTDCDLLWMARGGYGLTRIVGSLELPRERLPTIVGFSDATALLFHLWHHRKSKGIHAPTLTHLANESSESLHNLWLILDGRAQDIQWPRLEKLWWPSNDEEVEGHLLTGNLCVLTHLIGTSSMPSLKGSILVLEETNERPYRIDRMLTQLWSSGSLHGVKAIVLGQLSSCTEPGLPALTPESVFSERCERFQIPLCSGLPVGHDTPNRAIPFGVQAKLKVSDRIELKILEEIF